MYRTLINDNYEEPANANFPRVTSKVLADLRSSSESRLKMKTVVMIVMYYFIISFKSTCTYFRESTSHC